MTVENPPTEKPFKEFIPTEFHDRPYLKDFLDKNDTPETRIALFNKLDGAEKLIGKKTVGGIPAADAKPEEVEAFYKSLGAAKPEDYEFKLGEKSDEEFNKELRAAAHNAGLSKTQMAKFIDKIAPGVAARQAAAVAAQTKLNTEFDALVAKTFGADNAKIVARVKEALTEHTPAELKPFADKLDNNALAILTGVVNAIILKYTPEDDLKSKDGGDNKGADKAALQEEARKLQASEAWKNWQHPDHAKTQARVKEIYGSPAFKA